MIKRRGIHDSLNIISTSNNNFTHTVCFFAITKNVTSLELAKSYENPIIHNWSINWLVLYDVTSLCNISTF